MVDIANRSSGATSGLVYDILQIVTSVLLLIGEEHHISTHDEETYTLYGPSIRPLMSSTTVKMQHIQGLGRGGERGGQSTHETMMLPPSTSSSPFAIEASTPPSSSTPHVIQPLSPTSPP